MEYLATIGLEVHVQLQTQSKIFCSCPTTFGAAPNSNTCPVCLGLPGALPVLNKKAVDLAISLGLALNCQIQNKAIWDRKNYFYQDLPKGYQITQLTHPLCLNGYINIKSNDQDKKININRIHMEEDAGKSIHDGDDERYTLVDLNRAGTPLCEIVSEPELESAQEAGSYLDTIRSIVRYTQVGDGNMEEGSLRCDANISIRPKGQKELGTKVEIKNLNSIKFLEKAINYEIQRQQAVITDGGTIVQETRLFDSHKNITQSMRSKEDSHDYRYFPDPDLVPLLVDDAWIQNNQKNLPELPQAKCQRFINEHNLSEYDAQVLTADKDLADYFEATTAIHPNPKKIANWIMTEIMRDLNDKNIEIKNYPINPKNLARLVELIDKNTISGTVGKTVLKEMNLSNKDPDSIITEQNLGQVSDTGAIESIIDDIIKANPNQLQQYKAGKDKLFGFFVGQTMKAMKGKANPQVVNEILKKKLN
ncbi:aspartyl/glutamyl-tRNA amidotransferase subunit B [bacterium K02(2017)]|nr:aspartyl/glutamyl-tRNA amidotransferase subunit B [bacterium K02(2017)]